MLKGAIIESPGIVFFRYHEVGVTKIRDHQIENPRLCKNVTGNDANALYLSTMLREMPCGKEEVVNYSEENEAAAEGLIQRLNHGSWSGFAEVDIEIPKHLWPKFAVPDEAVSQHMHDFQKNTGRNRRKGKKLVGSLSAEKMLVYAPLLCWYVDYGAMVKAVCRTINYKLDKIFTWFVEQVTEASRTGDAERSKVFKLLGNSGYGKLIEALERQTNVIYTKDAKVVDRALQARIIVISKSSGKRTS